MVLKVKDSFTGRKSGRNLDLQGGALLNKQIDRVTVGQSFEMLEVLTTFGLSCSRSLKNEKQD